MALSACLAVRPCASKGLSEVRRASLELWPLAGWIGRLLLIGAVVFWWGGIVVPRLISLSSSAVLPPQALPSNMDPDVEGSLANSVSAAALVVLGLLTLVNAVSSIRKAAGWVAVGGWSVMTLVAVFLAWEELSDFHVTGLTEIERSVFGAELVQEVGPFIWVLVLSPLASAFVVAMVGFIGRGLNGWNIRMTFVFGLVAWLIVLLLEVSAPTILVTVAQATVLGYLLEETLEFGGTLLFGLSAATAIRAETARPESVWFGSVRVRALFWWGMALAVVGCFFAAFVLRVPLVDARGPYTHADSFEVRLRDREAVMQELHMPAAPIDRIRLRLATLDPDAQAAMVGVRFSDLGTSEPELSGGLHGVPAGDGPRWRDIDLIPPLMAREGQPLALWVVADTAREAQLLIGATKTDPYDDGRLWVNGTLTWPDQDLEFVAYGATEPTLSKLRGIVERSDN